MKLPLFKRFDVPLAPPASDSAANARTAGVAATIRQALAAAGLDSTSGPLRDVSDTIHQALSSAGIDQGHPHIPRSDKPSARTSGGTQARHRTRGKPAARSTPTEPGAFTAHSFTGAGGSRDYRLYVPSGYTAQEGTPMPLVVMLHGCTQSPEDFAAGTRMNALAEQHGFLVAYPAQASNANTSKCWNWFRREDQQRDRGEPAVLAGIVLEIATRYRVDRQRIYVAGLSAGAAMAVILGATYPDVFAAVGAHSGLPYAAAHDMPSAFGAMQGNGGQAAQAQPPSAPRTPTIVFHGDRDHTVAVSNGWAISEQAARGGAGDAPLRMSAGPHGDNALHSLQRTVHADESDRPVVEHWLLHGTGHAWSGGSPEGSYTASRGPDASAEMVRFFLLHSLRSPG